ncbi:MAG: methyl-accepting chemotaxis protein [Pseudomonadota bacterium]
MSANTQRDLAVEGVREKANDITTLVAQSLAGSVRFGDADRINEILNQTNELVGVNLQSLAVFNSDGVEMARSGPAVSSSAMLAVERAFAEGQKVTILDGVGYAAPIRAQADGIVIGVLLTEWTTVNKLAKVAEQRHEQIAITGAILIGVLVVAGFVFHRSIAAPLVSIARRTGALADGDLSTEVKSKGRADEIGGIARNLETLRAQLHDAHGRQLEAKFQAAGFEASSAALLMVNTDLVIKQFNDAFPELISEVSEGFASKGIAIDTDDLFGRHIDEFGIFPNELKAELATAEFPMTLTRALGDYFIGISIAPVENDNDERMGYIFEWRDETQERANRAIIQALDAGQMRAEFTVDGNLVSINKVMREAYPHVAANLKAMTLDKLLAGNAARKVLGDAAAGETVSEEFELRVDGKRRVFDGTISPLQDRKGNFDGLIMLGQDVTTQVERSERSEAEAEATRAAQEHVVESMQTALDALAAGNLAIRLSEPFEGGYEQLRTKFNDSVKTLDDAVSIVVDNSNSILGEASNISDAAGDLSKRTEQQAATLEEFSAALAEITASVSSASEGTTQAHRVVNEARENAEASGEVVREAVEAMGQISSSSDQISRIIGVIDDIAFQTNLLALNAGVEAARAGDAGRGFAVVASEVRALAQRSSDAAREINELISTSGGHVKRGVSLVDKAGTALTEIVESVGGIAEHVATIAASAKEQSTGLDEINTAISHLDQVTQQNVAMFEETTAATHTLTAEANQLVGATQRFSTTSGGAAAKPAKAKVPTELPDTVDAQPGTVRPKAGAPAPSAPVHDADGALALALEEGGWEDF